MTLLYHIHQVTKSARLIAVCKRSLSITLDERRNQRNASKCHPKVSVLYLMYKIRSRNATFNKIAVIFACVKLASSYHSLNISVS